MQGFHVQTFKNRTKISCRDQKFIYLYTNHELDVRKKFDATCIGSYVMFFGSVLWDEHGKPYLMLEEWGSYAVIPKKHEVILNKITSEL